MSGKNKIYPKYDLTKLGYISEIDFSKIIIKVKMIPELIVSQPDPR
ncbi:MAG: hypothetical protein QXU67_02975 [Candidatus Bathyarchaeia archaeon]